MNSQKIHIPNASVADVRFVVLFVILFSSLSAFAQKVDTVVNMGIYKSYFSYGLKQPLYVTYTLYQGGGGCDRQDEGFSFKKCGVNTASDEDYSGFGFDKGHLANAEDFAHDCDKEEKTFCYYNCVPQTVKLNRGIWKTWEEKVRVHSQTQKVFVIAGAIYKDKKQGPNAVGVPDWCYKIVINPKTKKTIYCVLFPNDNSKTAQEITLAKLKKKLGYPLMP
jgi:endonuclease G